MKRIVQLAIVLLILSPAGLRAAKYESGVHYFELIQAQETQAGENVEVLELFWYGCPHCYALEPFMEHWVTVKPENAEYVLLPGIFRRETVFHARAYYTFAALGVVDKVHRAFYDEIHQRGNRVADLPGLLAFGEEHGIDPQQMEDAYNSFVVDTNLRNARKMFGRYEATGVPTIIVDGRYRVTVSSAGSHEELLNVINFLVEKVASERTS